MAQDTTRDQLWKYALSRTHTSEETITTALLEEISGASTRSCRDVLETMASYNLLISKRDGNGRVYYPNADYFVDGRQRDFDEFTPDDDEEQ